MRADIEGFERTVSDDSELDVVLSTCKYGPDGLVQLTKIPHVAPPNSALSLLFHYQQNTS